jgi:hypothetical protein
VVIASAFLMCVSGFKGGLVELCFSCVVVGLWLFFAVDW